MLEDEERGSCVDGQKGRLMAKMRKGSGWVNESWTKTESRGGRERRKAKELSGGVNAEEDENRRSSHSPLPSSPPFSSPLPRPPSPFFRAFHLLNPSFQATRFLGRAHFQSNPSSFSSAPPSSPHQAHRRPHLALLRSPPSSWKSSGSLFAVSCVRLHFLDIRCLNMCTCVSFSLSLLSQV